MSKFIIFFDTETGGVEPQQPTIQLAAVAVNEETGQEVASFEVKLKFDESAADKEALAMNHYDPAVWQKEAIQPLEAAGRFALFTAPFRSIQMVSKRTGATYGVAKLAGYNALTFDLPRLKQMFGTAFFPCSYHVRDVLQRAMWWVDEHKPEKPPENLKLTTMCQFFGIETNGAHDSLTDVRLTAALVQKLKEAA